MGKSLPLPSQHLRGWCQDSAPGHCFSNCGSLTACLSLPRGLLECGLPGSPESHPSGLGAGAPRGKAHRQCWCPPVSEDCLCSGVSRYNHRGLRLPGQKNKPPKQKQSHSVAPQTCTGALSGHDCSKTSERARSPFWWHFEMRGEGLRVAENLLSLPEGRELWLGLHGHHETASQQVLGYLLDKNCCMNGPA